MGTTLSVGNEMSGKSPALKERCSSWNAPEVAWGRGSLFMGFEFEVLVGSQACLFANFVEIEYHTCVPLVAADIAHEDWRKKALLLVYIK